MRAVLIGVWAAVVVLMLPGAAHTQPAPYSWREAPGVVFFGGGGRPYWAVGDNWLLIAPYYRDAPCWQWTRYGWRWRCCRLRPRC